MSLLQAYELAKSSEQKAYNFYDEALPNITDQDVRTLFVELRDEETEHVRMIEDAIAQLPPNANVELDFDIDESPAL
jgi:rubrerythrin